MLLVPSPQPSCLLPHSLLLQPHLMPAQLPFVLPLILLLLSVVLQCHNATGTSCVADRLGVFDEEGVSLLNAAAAAAAVHNHRLPLNS
jgi:hypothetical protein